MGLVIPKSAGGPHRDDLVGSTVVLTLRSVERDVQGQYGSSTYAFVDLAVIEGPRAGTVVDNWRVPGATAKVIADGIEVGEAAAGEIFERKGANGPYTSVKWVTNPERLGEIQKKHEALVPGF